MHTLTTIVPGRTSIEIVDTFAELSKAIDAAVTSPGFARYQAGPAGGR